MTTPLLRDAGQSPPKSLRNPHPGAAAHADDAHADDLLPLAPAAVMRAALWPVDTVAALAAAGAGTDDYEARMLRELEALWRLTLDDPRFCCALAACNPHLLARLQRASLPRRWNKRVRQLAATLYQYLARACWRTEPNGLWAGVRLLQWSGPALPPAERWSVAPHLGPLRALFEQRVADDAYAATGRYKLHPGLVRHAAGEWHLRTSRRLRRIRFNAVDESGRAAADRVLLALHGLAPATRAELIARAAGVLQETAHATSFIDTLVRGQVLLGGVTFPRRYETPWQAIDAAAALLQPAHGAAWNRCAARMRALCCGLEQRAGRVDAETIVAAMESAEHAVRTLAADWSLPLPALPRAVLHVDCSLPWRLRLDASVRARVAAALRCAETFRLHADPVTAHDRAHARAIAAGAAGVDDAALAGELARRRAIGRDWQRVHAQLPLRADAAPPFGVLLLRLGERHALVNGFSHEPWLAYGRFGALFAPAGAGDAAPQPSLHRHALHRWCEARLHALASENNVTPAPLVAPAGDAPNLWAQPRFAGLRPLDPYGTEVDQWPAAGLRLRSDGAREWIEGGGTNEPKRLLALCGSALDVGAGDRLLERLLLTSWRYRPAVQAHVDAELACGEALRLAAGTDWQRARWDLGPACAAALLAAAPAERWARWQELAARHRWPPLLTLGQAGGPPVLLARDSALAVETLLRGLRAGDRMIVEAAGDEGFARDEGGNRHATELAVVFARRHHAWQHDRPGAVAAGQPCARAAGPAAALARAGACRLGA